MRRAVLGTLAVHSVVALALVAIGARDVVPPAGPATSVELVDIVAPPTPTPRPSTPPSLAATSGGGSPARAAARIARATPAPHELHGDLVGDMLGTAAVDLDPGTGTGDGGRGRGRGGGIGDGVGAAGDGHLAPPPPPPAPPPPKISKARPPILIWPTRRSASDDDREPFLAEVVVDTDGDVAGAHLIRGGGGPHESDVTGLLFRFRYEPALDDDGRPIKARIQQPFLVQ